MIVDRILQQASERAGTRRPPRMGAWSVGRCVRQNWYMEHGATPEPMQPRSMLIFDLGDRIEDAVMDFIAAAKIGHVRTNDRRDTVMVPELGFRIRTDFLFECDALDWRSDIEQGAVALVPGSVLSPQSGELIVGEIKSMSDFAFAKAQRGIIDDAYLAQCECYMRAYDVRWALVIAYRKETSHLCEVLIGRDDARWARVIEAAKLAKGDAIPDRPFELDARCKGADDGTCIDGKTPGRGQAHKRCTGTGIEPGGPYIPAFPCGYCAYKGECWGAVEMTLRDGRPAWRLAA